MKHKILFAAIALVSAFAIGRYSVSNPDVKTIKDSEVVKDKSINKNTHKTIVHVKQPDGTETTTTEETTIKESDTHSVSNTHEDTTVTQAKKGATNISALLGTRINTVSAPVYGLSVSTSVLGPITVGVWGLDNGTIGAMAGLSF